MLLVSFAICFPEIREIIRINASKKIVVKERRGSIMMIVIVEHNISKIVPGKERT